MRKQFVTTVEAAMDADEKLVTILGDIGVFGFRNVFKKHPDRIYNIGICEQASISLAAGLAKMDLIPLFHSIAPFVVERCFEQLKNDFGYQKLAGNFVSVGGSFDYAGLGCTHHCPGDIGVLKTIPGMEIIVPGTSAEFDELFKESYNNNNPTYFRLSEHENKESLPVKFAKANVIKKGTRATVVVVGPMLDTVSEAVKELDITLLYYTTISPFDSDTLRENLSGDKIILCEPFYMGGLSTDIITSLRGRAVSLEYIGVPHKFLTNYGTYQEQRETLGLTVNSIKEQITGYLNE